MTAAAEGLGREGAPPPPPSATRSSERRASAEALEQQLLATASDADCQTILSQATLVLAQWLRHAPLACQAAPRLVQFALRALSAAASPQGAAAAATTAGPPTGFAALLANGPLVEAAFALIGMAAEASDECATALLESGAVVALRRALTVPQLLDSREFAASALALLGALGAASPEAALAVMLEGGHGVAQGIAAHWLLSGDGKGAGRTQAGRAGAGGAAATSEAAPRTLYTQAGSVLGALLQSSHDLRLDRAVSEARGRADEVAEAGSVATPPPRRASFSAGSGGGGSAAADERARRAKAALAEEKALEKLSQDAQALARTLSARTSATPSEPVDAAALLEMQAGRMPWAVAPRAFIDALQRQGRGGGGPVASAVAAGAQMDVWFLPDPVRPRKARRMNLALSPDLRVLTWSYRSQHHRRDLAWRLDLSSVEAVHTGLPLVAGTGGGAGGYQRRLFKRAANAVRSVSLEVSITADTDPSGVAAAAAWGSGAAPPPGGAAAPATGPLHLEAQTAEQHNTALRALSVLVQYARARAGILEPMPQVHVPARLLLGDEAPPARAAAALR